MNRLAFMVAGLCLCGAAVAQDAATTSLEGSNTGVVIKKAKVASTTGYQFLIVPVKGLNIASGDNTVTNVTLDAMLPHGSYEGCTVQVVNLPEGATGGSPLTAVGRSYTAGTAGWTYTAGDGTTDTTNGNKDEFPSGTILWLKDPEGTQTRAASAVTVFCGNANKTEVDWSAAIGQMTPLGNSTSDAIQISTVPGQNGAQLFRIKDGASDYEVYRYTTVGQETGWFKTEISTVNGVPVTAWVSAGTDTIPAAEAFYYYNPKTASN